MRLKCLKINMVGLDFIWGYAYLSDTPVNQHHQNEKIF